MLSKWNQKKMGPMHHQQDQECNHSKISNFLNFFKFVDSFCRYTLKTNRGDSVQIHPTSVNHQVEKFDSNWFAVQFSVV